MTSDHESMMDAAIAVADAARLSMRMDFDKKYGARGYMRMKCGVCGGRCEWVGWYMISSLCCGREMEAVVYGPPPKEG